MLCVCRDGEDPAADVPAVTVETEGSVRSLGLSPVWTAQN